MRKIQHLVVVTALLTVFAILSCNNPQEKKITDDYKTITVTKDIPYRDGNSDA